MDWIDSIFLDWILDCSDLWLVVADKSSMVGNLRECYHAEDEVREERWHDILQIESAICIF